MTASVVIAKDQDTFFKKAAQMILEAAAAAVSKKGRFTIALCGGSTPKKLFDLLCDSYYKERIPWSQTHVFWGDDRCVPPDHDDSNYKLAYDRLLSKVPIPAVNIHRIPTEMDNPREAARAYDQQLRLFFRLDGEWPKIDFDMLGMGEDGHTASLFPGTDALKEKEKCVVANFVEKLSTNRITLTLPVLNSAERTLVLCMGGNKANVLKEIFRDDTPPHRYPVQLIKPAGEHTWLLDSAAAEKLPPPVWQTAAHI